MEKGRRTEGYNAELDHVIKRIGSVDLTNSTLLVEIRSYNEQDPRIAVIHEKIFRGNTVREPRIPRLENEECEDLGNLLLDAADALIQVKKNRNM